MENVTTGHWVFAAIFLVAFVGFLIWSYRKDAAIHRIYYTKSARIVLVLVVLIFVLFIIKQLLYNN